MAASYSRHLATAADRLARAADHLAAAARHLAGAARAATRRHRHQHRRGENSDIESIPSPSPSSTPSSEISTVNSSGDDDDIAVDVDDMLAVLERSYELFGVLLGIGIPVPFYFAVPEETRAGAAWVWCVLTYAIAFTIGVTTISVRVFRSRCCLCTVLRALVLVVCLVAEVFAAVHLLPIRTSRFADYAAGFSIFHLVTAYLSVWAFFRR